MLVKEMKKYFHSDDLDYGIGFYNEETESMEYDNSIDVPNGEYPVIQYEFSKKKVNRKGYKHIGVATVPSFQGFNEIVPESKRNVYKVTADEKLVVVDGKFDAEQLSRIASDIKKKTKYWGCYLDNIEPQVTVDGEFTGELKVFIGS